MSGRGILVSGSSTSSSSSSDLSNSSQSIQPIIPAENLVVDTSTAGLEIETVSDEAVEYYCGIGRFNPKWMQIFRKGKFFTFILCLYCSVQGALVSGFTSVVLSSIERRYKFSSVYAGLIASVYDIAVVCSVLFVSYFAGRGHRPRWLGTCLIIQGVGSFVFSLPQFLFGAYRTDAGTTEVELCDLESHTYSFCSSADNIPLILFFIGNILIGIGASPLFTVGTGYLDDIIHPKYVSIHLGVFYAFSVIGPAMGYGLGGAFLSVYVDPWTETNLKTTDPTWVGAWWLCFIVAAVFSWIFAIPFLMFPKFLPDSAEIKRVRQQEMAQVYEGTDRGLDEVDLATKVKTFPKHLKQVLLTPSWVFITMAVSFSTLVISGVVSFAPKYLEAQFNLTSSTASITVGAIAIPCGGAGVLAGGLLTFLNKSKGRRVALINCLVSVIVLGPMLIFLVHCPTVNLAGISQPYPNRSIEETNSHRLNDSCFSSCGCNSSLYQPVCGENGLTYFSPCTAGCQKLSNETAETFVDCHCIDFSSGSSGGSAEDGQCDVGCNKLGLYLAIVALVIFLLFVLQIPIIIITVRSVAEEQRTLALGLQSISFRVIGSIPGPVVFGAIFDSACIYWQYECGHRGNCWVYDNVHLSQRAVMMGMFGIGFNLIFSFLTCLVYPKKTAKERNTLTLAPDSTYSQDSEEHSDMIKLQLVTSFDDANDENLQN